HVYGLVGDLRFAIALTVTSSTRLTDAAIAARVTSLDPPTSMSSAVLSASRYHAPHASRMCDSYAAAPPRASVSAESLRSVSIRARAARSTSVTIALAAEPSALAMV